MLAALRPPVRSCTSTWSRTKPQVLGSHSPSISAITSLLSEARKQGNGAVPCDGGLRRRGHLVPVQLTGEKIHHGCRRVRPIASKEDVVRLREGEKARQGRRCRQRRIEVERLQVRENSRKRSLRDERQRHCDALSCVRDEASGMSKDDLQIRITLDHAVPHDVGCCSRSIEQEVDSEGWKARYAGARQS